MRRILPALPVLFCLTAAVNTGTAVERTPPTEGLHDNSPNVHALTRARLIMEPGRVLEEGTIVVRDGIIVDIGADVTPPVEARIWDLRGKSIYPGFIDAFDQIEMPAELSKTGAPYWNSHIQSHRRASDAFESDPGLNRQLRAQGITARLIVPRGAIVKGTSSLVTTADRPGDQAIVAEQVAMHAQLTVSRSGGGDRYPNSPMGAVALARQTFYDAQWYRDAWRAFRAHRGVTKPEVNHALQALQPFLEGQRLVMIDAPDEQYLLRAHRFGNEFGLNVVVLGSGHEYRRLAEVQRTNRSIVVPLNFAKAPDVATLEAARDVSLESLMHWDHAPENPARLRRAGIQIAFTTRGLSKRSEFLSAVRTAVRRGLDADDALRAMTIFPARLFGVDDRIGTLENGKLAHFVVTDGDIFDKKTKVLQTWIERERYEVDQTPRRDPVGTWNVDAGGEFKPFTLHISGTPRSLKAKWVSGDPDVKTQPLKQVRLQGTQLTATFSGELFSEKGVARLSAVLLADEQAMKLIGRIVTPAGIERPATFLRVDEPVKNAEADDRDSPDDAQNQQAQGAADEDRDEGDNESQPTKERDQDGPAETSNDGDDEPRATFPVTLPLGAYGREQPPEAKTVAFKNATVWTCEPDGILKDATVVIHNGIIQSVGSASTDLPGEAAIVDCRGKHITPGIIDCHSHMATDGGVNESGQANTAEVRIGDFIDANDISIYRQLAGGVTTANILHGSANPIGGQNQVIKLRWGAAADGLKFAEAPEGIKFALGENVTQSNLMRPSRRYPQSRMGVEQIVRDAFLAARQYHHRRVEWAKTHQGLPPRRDLELDAIVEVLDGTRWIHCHSYRQDEILALLRTLESFHVQIGSLQHILEGYKLAGAMKKHGAMASAFSDWWAYKFEVYDAIPYNGALMHEVGIVVSFNSDDQELARHLNHEAAKAIKYGNVAPQEALKFVTLNPALQLRIDKYVGSLRPGKQADLVVWSGPPLSTRTRCEQTWIDGRKYFDIDEDRESRAKWSEMRTRLVQKILNSGQDMEKPAERKPQERELWPRVDIYCQGYGSR